MIRNQRYDLSLRNKGLAALLYYVKKDEQPPNYAHLVRDQAPLGVAHPPFFYYKNVIGTGKESMVEFESICD